MKKAKGKTLPKAARKPSAKGRATKGPSPAKRSRRRASGEISGEISGDRIPQPHGGALLSGGLPGHKGGRGRPTNEIREIARGEYDTVVPRLGRIARGEETRKGKCPTCGEYVTQEEPTLKESVMAATELRAAGIGNRVEVDAPSTPLVVAITVGPEVARERGEA